MNIRNANWIPPELPAPVAKAMREIFGSHRPLTGNLRDWLKLLLGIESSEVINGKFGHRMYNVAGFAHEGAAKEFEAVLAEIAAVATAYFLVHSPPPKRRKKSMNNYVFEPIHDTDGKVHFEISDRETGNLLHTTPPRKVTEIARLDIQKWFQSESAVAREAIAQIN